MYPLLILREEILCLIILVSIWLNGHYYSMGKDKYSFHRIGIYAIGHVVFDIITILTVNNLDVVPEWFNFLAHVIFYLFAILFAHEFFCYIMGLCYSKKTLKTVRIATIIPLLIYIACLPLLPIVYLEGNGTNYSYGLAAYVGYALGMILFIAATVVFIINYKKLDTSTRVAITPMLALLMVGEVTQIIVPELLFTSGAITIITIGFFFSLENPAFAFKQKLLKDSLTGVKNRQQYEIDIDQMEKDYAKNHELSFGLLFCDINHLKHVNDSFGHFEGDTYIAKIAEILTDCLKSTEKIYRISGDEFVVIYKDVNEAVIQKEIQNVHNRCEMESCDLEYDMSVAIGYEITSKKYNTLRSVLKVADYIMYQNKLEMKRQLAITSDDGQKLNIDGLTDNLFEVFSTTNDTNYLTICNMKTNVSRWSLSAVEHFGMPGEFMFDCLSIWLQHIHPDDLEEYRSEISQIFSGKKNTHEASFRALNKNGEYVMCTCNGKVLKGKNGEPDMFISTIINHNITGTIDHLTGLPNQTAWIEYCENLIANNETMTFVAISPLNLTQINGLYNYVNGNKVLQQLSFIIKKITRERGKVFKTSGTKFIIALKNISKQEILQIYDDIQQMSYKSIYVDELMLPIKLTGGNFELSENFQSVTSTIENQLVRLLDLSAENNGKFIFYEEESHFISDAGRKLLAIIHQDAVSDKKGFFLKYQPILSMDKNQVIGAEALLRWRDHDGNEVSPGKFVPWLENDPCFFILGQWIVNQALKDACTMASICPNFVININITVHQLADEKFSETLLNILNESGFPPQQLCLELTERCRELDFKFLKSQIDFYHTKGIKIAMDDIGSGFSSIETLLKLPIDEIKLDKTFVTDILTRKVNQAFVRAMVDASNHMGYHCCLEGIEDEATYNYLKQYGADSYQGYYFSKPVTVDEFINIINKQK